MSIRVAGIRRTGEWSDTPTAIDSKESTDMDLVEAYAAAAARAGEVIAATRPDQLESSTPCRTWTARELVNHIVAGQYLLAGAASGAPLPDTSAGTPDFAGGDAIGAQRDASSAAAAAFSDPGLGERMAELPFGTLPAGMVPGLACFEQVVHGWDLARATGQEPAMPAEVVEVLFPFAEQLLANAPRDGAAFAAVVDVSAGAPVIDRLIALSGRRP
ncbi:MAG: TIGR03086 family metal-binding protein [Actinomycetota bacterium]|nr:TIGR03086 family metal-binding protein [Actinomycetota bacterium]